MIDYATHLSGSQKLNDQGFRGKGITIAVLDTGCNPHPLIPDIEYRGYTENESVNDDVGHGTWVCSKIVEIAPLVRIVSIKVLMPYGGSTSWVLDALNYCKTREDIDLINMSLSGGRLTEPTLSYYKKVVKDLWDIGKPIICAAGNDGDGRVTYPALFHDLITVGSVSKEFVPSWFSNESNEIDVCAIGEDSLGASSTGTGTVKMSGTSMATPIVTGMCAIIIEKLKSVLGRGPTSDEIYTTLMMNTLDVGQIGKDNKTGVGIASFNPEYNILDMYIDKEDVIIKSPRSHSLMKTDVAPTIINNRTMVPVRFISEKLGGMVTWNEKDEKGNLVKNINIRL